MFNRKMAAPLRRLTQQYPVVTLTGPRQSGKTTLCKSTFPDMLYYSMEDLDTRQMALADPRTFLERSKSGAIIDEIQKAPDLVSYIQGIVDRSGIKGQFILTGSEQFELTHSIAQSLAGRTAIMKLLPLSYDELYTSAPPPLLDDLIYSGFYPRIHHEKLNPTEAFSFYVNTYLERDVRSLKNIANLRQFEAFLKLCAANVGQELNKSRLGNDIGVDHKTIGSWLSVLEASYIIFLLPPHFKNLRKRVTKSPKIYFHDIGLAAHLMGIKKPTEIAAHPLRGSLFENFVVTELIKSRYNRAETSNLYFYRDSLGNEVDVIIENGAKCDAVEIKSSATFASSFLKGLHYYRSINPDLAKQWLIYSGQEESQVQGICVRSYVNIGDV